MEYGQAKLLDDGLCSVVEVDGQDEMQEDLLKRLMQHALVHGQAEAAAVILKHNARLDYYDPTQLTDKENLSSAWKDLVKSAFNEQHQRCMRVLFGEASSNLSRWVKKDHHPGKASLKLEIDEKKLSIDQQNPTEGENQPGNDNFCVKNEVEAVWLLEEVYYQLVTVDKKGNALPFSQVPKDLCFIQNKGGAWTGNDANLMFFVVITLRPGLAKLFFIMDARASAASALPNALWACLFCRHLAGNFKRLNKVRTYDSTLLAAWAKGKREAWLSGQVLCNLIIGFGFAWKLKGHDE